MSGLIWVHIVCKGYHQTALVDKELTSYEALIFCDFKFWIMNALHRFGVFLCTNTFNSLSLKCCLLITFANSFETDQARHSVGPDSVGPDLDPICFDTQTVFLKKCFEKVDFEKNQQMTKKWGKFLRG